MSEVADRYRNLAAQLTERVKATPADAWDRPSPCEGWSARDVVRHIVETSQFFLGRAGVEISAPSVDDDPAGAWEAARDAVLRAIEDPATAGTEYETPMGKSTLEQTIGMFGLADLLIHTWDISRAAGLDEHLDPTEVHRIYEALLPNDEMMRQGGVFGAKVEVPADADEQTKLLAFTGRRP